MGICAPIPDHVTNETILAPPKKDMSSTLIKLVYANRTRKLNLFLLTNINTPASGLETCFDTIFFSLRPLSLQVSTTTVN